VAAAAGALLMLLVRVALAAALAADAALPAAARAAAALAGATWLLAAIGARIARSGSRSDLLTMHPLEQAPAAAGA
jgi:hypothetical protein